MSATPSADHVRFWHRSRALGSSWKGCRPYSWSSARTPWLGDEGLAARSSGLSRWVVICAFLFGIRRVTSRGLHGDRKAAGSPAPSPRAQGEGPKRSGGWRKAGYFVRAAKCPVGARRKIVGPQPLPGRTACRKVALYEGRRRRPLRSKKAREPDAKKSDMSSRATCSVWAHAENLMKRATSSGAI